MTDQAPVDSGLSRRTLAKGAAWAAPVVIGAGAAPMVAASCGTGTVTKTYTAPGTYTLTIPVCATTVTFAIEGGNGGDSMDADLTQVPAIPDGVGKGAQLAGVLTGVAGKTLTIKVGQAGVDGYTFTTGAPGGSGYGNGGRGPGDSGSGGGGTAILDGTNPLAVAGGGGGSPGCSLFKIQGFGPGPIPSTNAWTTRRRYTSTLANCYAGFSNAGGGRDGYGDGPSEGFCDVNTSTHAIGTFYAYVGGGQAGRAASPGVGSSAYYTVFTVNSHATGSSGLANVAGTGGVGGDGATAPRGALGGEGCGTEVTGGGGGGGYAGGAGGSALTTYDVDGSGAATNGLSQGGQGGAGSCYTDPSVTVTAGPTIRATPVATAVNGTVTITYN